MTLTVHTISGAPRGWRALVGLTLKGLDYEVRYLEGSKREHKSAEFLRINPRGMVPVLDRQYPDKPLFGDTPDEAARIWQLTMECCDYLRDAAEKLLFPILVQNVNLSELNDQQLGELTAASEALDRKGEAMAFLGFEHAATEYPSLFGWMHRVSSINGMDRTLPYHW